MKKTNRSSRSAARKARIRHLMDVMLKDSESYDGKMSDDARRLWRDYLHPFRIQIWLGIFITLIWSIHPYAMALATRFLVDQVIQLDRPIQPEHLVDRLPYLWQYIRAIVIIWSVFVLCHWLRSWMVLGIGQKLVFNLRRDLHEKLNALHVGYFERNETGRIMSRVLEDVWVIRDWSTNQILNFSAHILRLITGIGILFVLNPLLTALIIFSMPIYFWAMIKIRPIIRELSIAIRKINSRMYALSQERINGIAVAKAFAQEQREKQNFALLMSNFVRLAMRVAVYNGAMQLFAALVTAMVTGLIIFLGVSQYRQGRLSAGDVIVFIQALPNLFQQISALAKMYVQIQAVFVVIKRVFNVLDETEEIPPGSLTLTGMKGSVYFNHVSFRYPGQTAHALHDVSFYIDPGQKIALMGPSGSGKSTVFQLLLRFYEPQDGEVSIGGVNLVNVEPQSLRRHTVLVQQEPVIFSGTIAQNIAYSRTEALPREIMSAAKQAELHDFIMTLPVKYETEVGQNGITLSGGQKQRLALATALLTEPQILLLDDTTSALDAETEARIRSTLERVLVGRTSLIITQRIATAMNCNKIIVLEEGKITQLGTHSELLSQEGFYQRVFKQQESM